MSDSRSSALTPWQPPRPIENLWMRFARWAHDESPLGASVLVGCIAFGISLFLYAPMIWAWGPAFFGAGRAHDFLQLCEKPLRRDLTEPLLAYRIVLPLLCKAFGLTGYVCFVPQFLANIAAHAAIFHATRRFYPVSTATWATVLLGLTNVAISSNTWMGIPDSVTILCIALLLGRTSPQWGWLPVLIGATNDERMLLGLPFVALWWHFHEPRGGHLRAQLISTLAGLALWWLGRFALRTGLIGPGIVRPDVYSDFWNLFLHFRPTTHSWPVFFANVFLGYRWLWLLVAVFVARASWPPISVGLASFSTAARDGFVVLLGAAILAVTGAGDVTRGVAFFFPAILLAVCWARRYLPQSDAWLCRIAVLQVLTPGFFFGTDAHFQINYPLPLALLRWWLGGNPLASGG